MFAMKDLSGASGIAKSRSVLDVQLTVMLQLRTWRLFHSVDMQVTNSHT
jgi:hypothetical protein